MSRVSIKGVVIGALVDVFSSGLAGIPLVYYALTHMGPGASPGEGAPDPARAVMTWIHADPTLHTLQMALGLACSILGGYVAARIAKHDAILNGASSSFLCVALGIYSIASGKSLESPLVHVALSVVAVAAAALGGYLGKVRASAA